MDVLKIDMTFVRDILESPRSQIILSEIIHMMHRLNLTMIAEGVENPEQTKLLRLGLQHGPGLLFCPAHASGSFRKNSSMRHRDKKKNTALVAFF